MSTSPEQIREEMDITRGSLSGNVNALADRVRPGKVARRQAGKVRTATVRLRERVMGTASDLTSSGSDTASSAASSVADTASSVRSTVGEAASSAPGQIREQTQGNPLAAGLIAFGVGWLAASLAPATRPEQQAAGKLKDSAGPVTDTITEAARQVGEDLREPAQQAAQQVRQTASEAASTVVSEGRSAATGLKDQAEDAGQTIKEQTGRGRG